ncbi:MAG: hypothetical protein JKY06_04605 [Alcanivorax sp.]|nr:hypothetical protein [Alcanivorax sp.]
METITLSSALAKLLLEKHGKPVVADHELVRYVYDLYKSKQYRGVPIGKLSADTPTSMVIDRNIGKIERLGLISRIESTVPAYQVVGYPEASSQQIVCSVVPDSYLAYLSAMEWHGITDRVPSRIHIVMCADFLVKKKWKQKAKEDYGPSVDDGRLIPKIGSLKNPIKGKRVVLHETKNFSGFREVSGSGGIKVASLGQTFLDMMRAPEFCGGFSHVLECYKQHAEKNLPIIIKAVDKTGRSIDKVRIGYVLEEVLGIKNRTIESWKAFVQRGGSRKLIAKNKYSNSYSAEWCISINE